MTITDTGGDMKDAFTWRISLNGTQIAQNTFKLTAGQTFNINTAGLFGTLTLDVLDLANTVVASGSMVCNPPPPPPPSFTVGGSCGKHAAGVFTITDVGGDMTVPFTWRIDRTRPRTRHAIAQHTFQIKAGQSITVKTRDVYGTLTLSVLDASNTTVASGSMVCKGQG